MKELTENLCMGNLRQVCLLKLQINISFSIQLLLILITAKREALRLNIICSDNEKFDKRCNDLEK